MSFSSVFAIVGVFLFIVVVVSCGNTNVITTTGAMDQFAQQLKVDSSQIEDVTVVPPWEFVRYEATFRFKARGREYIGLCKSAMAVPPFCYIPATEQGTQ
jgi:quinol-cytochrome oxidoreductase complex cytochrome b subunit